MPPDRRAGRLARLRSLAGEGGLLRLEEAARALNVSPMTIRRDLAEPPDDLSLLGGHVVSHAGPGGRARYSLDTEAGTHRAAKRAAGIQAAGMVEPGDTIFVDCGTTLPYLVDALDTDLRVTIVCYALNIAVAATRLARAQIFLLGGLFHSPSATFLSDEAVAGLSRIGIGKAFLSAGGLHETQGATCSNFNEVPVKRAVLDRAVHSFLVIDSSKQGLVRPAHFAEVDAFERIVTERG
jgi:DeoR family deoxyribose operon repressor